MGLFDRVKGALTPPADDAVAAVPSTWWQVPTLAPARNRLKVVGESHYQRALEVVAGGRTPDGCRVTYVMAQLVREPRNRHDRNAVRVDIAGHHVGYVARTIAPSLHYVLDHLAAHGFPATCRAHLTGGWQRGWNDQGSIGVELELAAPLAVFEPAKHGALPEGSRVSVTREEHYVEHLAAVLGGESERDVVGTLRVVDADPHARKPQPAVEVSVLGEVVGYLTPKMSERYAPLVVFAGGHRLPATTRTLVTRRDDKVEAFVRLPKDPTPLTDVG